MAPVTDMPITVSVAIMRMLDDDNDNSSVAEMEIAEMHNVVLHAAGTDAVANEGVGQEEKMKKKKKPKKKKQTTTSNNGAAAKGPPAVEVSFCVFAFQKINFFLNF
jgi:hypothetical protein